MAFPKKVIQAPSKPKPVATAQPGKAAGAKPGAGKVPQRDGLAKYAKGLKFGGA